MKIYISRGSVAAQESCGGIFNNHIIAIVYEVSQWN